MQSKSDRSRSQRALAAVGVTMLDVVLVAAMTLVMLVLLWRLSGW